MRVDVINLVGGYAGIVQSLRHGARTALDLWSGRGDVVGVAGRAVARNLRDDSGAARPGVLQLLQHQHAARAWSDTTHARGNAPFAMLNKRTSYQYQGHIPLANT